MTVDKFDEFDLYDYEYPKLYDQSAGKDISQLDRDEVLAQMTFLIRADHFGNRRFAAAVESGRLEKLCRRLHETLE